MNKKHWFVPKLYGWGFVPVSIQGWLLTLVFIAIVLASFYSHGLFEAETAPMTPEAVAGMLVDFVIQICVFSLIAIQKTEGKVKWNWGFRRK